MARVTNWAGNVDFTPSAVTRPGSVEELQQDVADAVAAGRRVRAMGAAHSFSEIGATDGVLIATDRLDDVVGIDLDAMTVTVEPGLPYARLGPFLHGEELAVHNLGSLPHLTVAGAVVTATHGSGDRNQNLAGAVESIEVVGTDGEIVRIDRHTDSGAAAIVGLGGFGVVARVTLRVEPTFDISQEVLVDLPFESGVTHLDELLASAYSVSLFTDWRTDVFHQVWRKHRVRAGGPLRGQAQKGATFGASAATTRVHPVPGMSADACTEQLGRPGPWHLRLPHFRAGAVPSVGAELQSEYFVDRADGAAALRAVRSLRGHLVDLVLVTEVRSVAADEFWLSPAYGRDSLAIHFTWHPDQPRVLDVLPALEAALAPFGARPHWAKLASVSSHDLRARYPRFDEAVATRRRFDPEGVFRNDFLDRAFAAAPSGDRPAAPGQRPTARPS